MENEKVLIILQILIADFMISYFKLYRATNLGAPSIRPGLKQRVVVFTMQPARTHRTPPWICACIYGGHFSHTSVDILLNYRD